MSEIHMIAKNTGIFTRSGLITGVLIACLLMAAIPLCSAQVAGSETVLENYGSTAGLSSSGNGETAWNFEIDTKSFKPDEYIIQVSAVNEDVTKTALFNVYETSAPGQTRKNLQQTQNEAAQTTSPKYYITIDPVDDHHVGDTFTITGRTNLPEGADLLIQVYSSTFKPTQKSQSGEFSGATGTVKASSVGWWATSSQISAGSHDNQPPMINTNQEKLSADSPPAPLAPLSRDNDAVGADTKIIKTASVTLEVDDVPRTVGLFQEMVTAQGGYLSSSTVQMSGSRKSGTVVLRIPQARFEQTMTGIKSTGTVKYVTTKGEDVTEEYVDLMAKKRSYEVQLEQYYVLMKKATKISDILAIQQRIDQVQTELNRLEGRLKYLDSRINFSTITVTLQEPEPLQVHADTGHSFMTAINKGINSLYGIIDMLIILTISLLPFLVIGGLGFGIYLRWKRNPPVTPAAEKDLPE